MPEPLKTPESLKRGYEGSDVNVGRLFAFAAGVVGLIIMGILGSLAAFHFFVSHEPLGPPASPFENVRELPPVPRLQTSAPLDLEHYRAAQNKILDNYGWVDAHAGVVRIPIDRAMNLLLQKGYPVRGGSPEKGKAKTPGPPAGTLTAPTPRDGEEVH